MDSVDLAHGEDFRRMYARHRAAVQAELERAGLPPQTAERSLGAVFERWREALPSWPPDTPVISSLLVAARQVARATLSADAPERAVQPLRCDIDASGFYGSGA